MESPEKGKRAIPIEAPIIDLPEHQAIYVAIQKVASSSMLVFMAHLLRIEIPAGKGPHLVFWDHPMLRRDELGARGDRWRFCVVRNPWDRLVSCYHSKIEPSPTEARKQFTDGIHQGFTRFGSFHAGMTFDGFARAVAEIDDDRADPHFLSQHRFITDSNGDSVVDYVGRFERMDEMFREICARLGVTDFALPHHKRTERRAYRDYFTPELTRVVARRYEEDLARFEYAF